jgi:hypothetical protein
MDLDYTAAFHLRCEIAFDDGRWAEVATDVEI